MSSTAPTFAYRAQSLDGQPLSGTIDAATADQARERLESLRLRVLELEPAASAATSVRALRGDDFVTFNQQLAHLTAAGLPMEQGLRLIAQDLRRGKVAATVRQIADDLEKGSSLGDAFQKYANRFPPAYGRLIDAGVRSSNLSGMLLSLGQHLQTVARLRSALWRALSYPIMVFLALCFVLAFIGHLVLPKFEEVFKDFGTRLPLMTELLLSGSRVMGTTAIIAAALLIAAIVLWQVLRSTGRDAGLRDAVGLRLPLIGQTLKRSLISRWCDAVRLGVSGGMDLPSAMRTASDAVGSPRLAREVEQLVARLEAGQPLDDGRRYRLIPATVLAAMDLSTRQGGPGVLAQVLGTLSQMYQQQARAKVGLIPAVLTPLMLALLTGIIGFVIVAMFAPLITLIQSVSGGGK
ncbi:MAG: type secretory pathway, component PulF [Phycisphaerales bacterium]|nr:type secretory pathway, component PulF [Phycisphaerales bacterium]